MAEPPAEGLSDLQQKILDAIAWYGSVGITTPSRSSVAAIAGSSANSSWFERQVGNLRAQGLVSYPAAGSIAFTETGAAAARAPSTPATLEGLHQAWLNSEAINTQQKALLQELIFVYPNELSREELALKTGSELTSSWFERNVGRLTLYNKLNAEILADKAC